METIDVFGRGIEIPKNSNLNDYITPGKYYSVNTENTSTITGKPSYVGGGFSLYVLRQGYNGAMQVIVQNTGNSNFAYSRLYVSGRFESWFMFNSTVQD